MRSKQFLYWLSGLVLAVAFLLPNGLAAQEPTPAPGGQGQTTTPEGQRPRRERCEQARERLRGAKQQLQEERERYRQIVQQYGKDSAQAREARERLRQHMQRMREARQRYSEHCGQGGGGRRDLEGGTPRRRNPSTQSQNPPDRF